MSEHPKDEHSPQEQGKPAEWRELDDLAPRYEHELHGSYLRALVQGIRSGRATNIALSGPYGSGKSSILDGLVQLYAPQVVQVSLATIRQSPDDAAPGGQDGKLSSTAELQKEIVKQILYVVDPAKTPASRFSRVSRFRWGRSAIWALVAGLAAISAQWLITIVLALAQRNVSLVWAPEVYVPTFLAAGILVFFFLRLTNGRWKISDLTAGPARLTLSDKEGSYFDDYLDEIVYFFQASKKRLVLIEDMERFKNVEVFEDLRALNLLLNHASQLKSSSLHRFKHRWNRMASKTSEDDTFDTQELKQRFHKGPIVFIYAIRDSLLTTKVETNDEIGHDAFTRSKFFDLIVPVVPFVTHQNARGALKKELGLLAGDGVHKNESSSIPSNDLVSTIAQYFPDQRQIRNIRNEFTMYREQLLQPGRHPAELTANRLLALVLYKNLEVAEFELIRLGQGKLYLLLELSRALVKTNLARISSLLETPTEAALELQAQKLGADVTSRAAALEKTIMRKAPNNQIRMTEEGLSTLQFWREVVENDSLLINGAQVDRQTFERGFNVSLTFAESVPILIVDDERQQLEEERAELEQATWARLWSSPKFTLDTSTFEDYPTPTSDNATTERSFAQIVVDVFGEGLAADLIMEGHLTQNFGLLSAGYDVEFLGLEAQDFVTRVMEEPGRRPFEFISPVAVGQIITEKRDLILERAGMVNIHVLSYLLSQSAVESHRLLAQLRNWSSDDQAFLQAFFKRYAADTAPAALLEVVAYIAELAPSMVGFIATDATIPEPMRTILFDTALSNVTARDIPDAVATSPSVSQFAKDNQLRIMSLALDGEPSARAARCLVRLGVELQDVEPISKSARDVFAAAGMFTLTAHNLQQLSGGKTGRWVSLEDIKGNDPLYQSTLRRIDEYLDLLEAETAIAHTAHSPEGLVEILSDLEEMYADSVEKADLLRRVTACAATDATVDDVADLAGSLQDALLFERRALPTTRNLFARFISAGGFTESLAQAIHDSPRPTVTEQNVSKLTNQAVRASREYPSLLTPSVLSDFVDQVSSLVTVDSQSILKASDSVAIRLIEDKQVNVVEVRSLATSSSAWVVREELLSSEPAPDPTELESLVSKDEVGDFVTSARIPITVRKDVTSLLDTFPSNEVSAVNASAVARFLLNEAVPATRDQVVKLRNASANAVLELLLREPAKATLLSDPNNTLRSLGGDYAALVDRDVTKSPTFAPDVAHQRFLDELQQIGVIRLNGKSLPGRLRVTRLYPA